MVSLAACSTPQRNTLDRPPAQFTQEIAQTIQQYLYLASSEPEPFNWRYRMLAAERLRELGRIHFAQEILSDISLSQIDDNSLVPWVLLSSLLYIDNDEPQAAIDQLYDNRLDNLLPGLSPSRQLAVHLMRSRAHVMNAQPLLAFEEALWALEGVRDNEADAMQLAVWEMLMGVARKDLIDAEAKISIDSPPEALGWLRLALLCRDFDSSPQRKQRDMNRWRSNFPTHSAELSLLPETRLLLNEIFPLPNRISMLLPLSGPFSDVGNAVRDGFLAAWYSARQRGEPVPGTLEFLDTAAESVQSVYSRLSLDEPQLVIGPLLRDKVDEMIELQPELPVLTLNYSPDGKTAGNVTQFGLNPGDEIDQLIALALARGWRSVMVVRQEEDWTSRVSQQFVSKWQSMGGIFVVAAVYTNERDVARSVERALGLRDSKTRRRSFEKMFNARMQFEPRRRQDVDFIVLLSGAEAARLIRPVLSFHRADDLPVVSISRVYDHTVDEGKNTDLNDVLFTEIPWFTEPLTIRELTGLTGDDIFSRMHALGVDSWHLLPWLNAMRADADAGFFGVTGRLSINRSAVVRQLDWATVRQGRLHMAGGRSALSLLPVRVPQIIEGDRGGG